MTLTEQLKEYASNSSKRHPGAAQDIMKKAIEELENTDILANAVKTGGIFPGFIFTNAKGEQVSLDDLLKKEKVVLTFYRGGWCPYCNIALRSLQNALPEIKAKGATLVAITPEIPDNTLTVEEKNALDFEVLTSKNNELAHSLGLEYKLPADLVALYKTFGIDLIKSQGNEANELPIAATYVIEQDKTISYHFLAEDYKLRADPLDIIKAL